VNVVPVMVVLVSVDSFHMSVLMLVGLVAIRSPETPDKIHEPERN
jgi:hypothetical protein